MTKNKVALITGSAKRLGAACARTLHGAGMNIIVHYRNSDEAAQKLKLELENSRPNSVVLFQADLLQFEKFDDLLKQVIAIWGRLDVLVNNASVFYPTKIGKITTDDWDVLLGINLKAPMFLSQVANQYLQKTQGCIINIADIYGDKPLKEHTVYSVAKAGLIMLTKSLARELGPKVRVNAIAPGAILWPENGMAQNAKQKIVAGTALKRSGESADIAKAVLYLAQDANYTTGQILVIDGGRTLSN